MRSRSLIAVVLAIAVVAPALAAPRYPPGAVALQRRLIPHFGPLARTWIAAEARRVAGGASTGAVAADARRADLGSPSEGDVEALCFLVLMEATNDQDSDLELIMAEVEAQTSSKQAVRDTLGNAPTNAMSEVSSELQLKLQMEQQRYSQILAALSNAMKAMSDTQSQIIKNLK